MSRPRKKAVAVEKTTATGINIDEIAGVQPVLCGFWASAGGQVPALTSDQAYRLALGVMSYRLPPVNPRAEAGKEKARQAMKALLDWCNSDPNDNGLPHVKIKDRRLTQLESAITAAQDLASASLARPWIYCARDLWLRIKSIAQEQGRKPGSSQNSHDIKFMSLVLKWADHPTATPNAIRKELEKDAEAERAA